MNFADLKYRMFYAPSPYLIDRAATLGCNWVILHSLGIEDLDPDPVTGRPMDRQPIYFEDYPKVAAVRRLLPGSKEAWDGPALPRRASVQRRRSA